jgi:hypothetical protein
MDGFDEKWYGGLPPLGLKVTGVYGWPRMPTGNGGGGVIINACKTFNEYVD